MNLQICGQIPDFNKKISTVRSRGLALIPILQNLGQFENRYPNGLSDEILGNCDTKISMSITDTKTAEYFCSSLGVASVENTSIRKSNSIEGDIGEYGQKSISTLKRNLLNIDEILRIPSDKLLVNLRGNNPLLLDKIIYKEHPLASQLKDSSILDYHPNWTKKSPIQEPKKTNILPESKSKITWDTF